MQRIGQLGKALYKTPVVVGETQKGAQLGNMTGPFPFGHSLNLFGVCGDTLTGNNMAQVLNFLLEEEALLKFGLQAFLLKATEHNFQPLQMLGHRGGEDDNIIKVQEERLTLPISKHPLHQPLESTWGVTQSERHPIELKKPEWSTKGGLGPIWLRHWHLVVPTGKING